MNKTIIIASILFCATTSQIFAQPVKNSDNKDTFGPNDFPKLIHANIPGAPKLSKPQLIMGDTTPVRGEGNGWAAPEVYDWDSDGKKDLLIGEFGSGAENGSLYGHFMRLYHNKGTDDSPEFYDDFMYAIGAQRLKESNGTPLSVFATCCLAFTPRFADLNNDGFTDLLTGQYEPGYISWFRGSELGFLPGIKLEEAYEPVKANEHQGSAHYYSLPITDPKGWSYWVYSSAAFGDFDNDGDQDMIVGGVALRICENIGTKSIPKFGKRELLFDIHGKGLESIISGVSTVPYVVDWDQDGVLDILLTDSFSNEGSVAIRYFRGLKGKDGLLFEAGIPLFTVGNGEKAFPGSWLNVCVTDWNNDGINDLLIGASIATLNGEFNHELSWQWDEDTGISKKNPKNNSARLKRIIDAQIKDAGEQQKKSGLSDEELANKNITSRNLLIKHYYVKEEYKTLAHKGFVYVMLGERNQ